MATAAAPPALPAFAGTGSPIRGPPAVCHRRSACTRRCRSVSNGPVTPELPGPLESVAAHSPLDRLRTGPRGLSRAPATPHDMPETARARGLFGNILSRPCPVRLREGGGLPGQNAGGSLKAARPGGQERRTFGSPRPECRGLTLKARIAMRELRSLRRLPGLNAGGLIEGAGFGFAARCGVAVSSQCAQCALSAGCSRAALRVGSVMGVQGSSGSGMTGGFMSGSWIARSGFSALKSVMTSFQSWI